MLKKTRIPIPAVPAPPTPRICKNPECGESFIPNPRNRTKNVQEYCGPRCRWQHWNKLNPRTKAAV